jgi:hypothetical protein
MEWSSVTPWSRSRVEERSHSNGIEWSGVVSGHSIELYGVPKEDVAKVPLLITATPTLAFYVSNQFTLSLLSRSQTIDLRLIGIMEHQW